MQARLPVVVVVVLNIQPIYLNFRPVIVIVVLTGLLIGASHFCFKIY